MVKINTSFSFAKWLENIVATWTEQTCVEFDISLLASADEARKKNPEDGCWAHFRKPGDCC